MLKNFLICLLFLIGLTTIYSQDIPTYNIDEITVTGSKAPTPFLELTRNVTLIKREDIKQLPVSSLPELLEYTLGVDIKQRGPQNVQSDLSIRGSSFEQTLILVDGIKISDSQTGHHNLNLPLSLNDIEKIEVLKGQGSSIHGANALAGVINIITKNSNERSLTLSSSYGSNGYYDTYLGFSQPLGILNNNISISKSHSNGYRFNTGYNNLNINYTPKIVFGANSISLFGGYQKKEFGANGFYSDKYPNQWEETKTVLSSVKGDFVFGNLFVSPKVSYRRHEDMYLLDHERPSFYKNVHKTDAYNFELELIYNSVFGSTALSIENGKDKINSTNLGNHNRNKTGFSLEQKVNVTNDLDISVGGCLYKYDKWGWKLWPSADIGYKLLTNFRIYGNIGNSFRLPTFTDLYYLSPAQVGNADLKPEEALSYEFGARYNTSIISVESSFFVRKGKNLIDWAKTNTTDVWHAQNIAELTTKGFEINSTISPKTLLSTLPITKVTLGYTFLDTDNSKINYISKYILDNLKHQAIISIVNELFLDIKQSWNLKYEYRLNSSDYFLMDTKLSKNFAFIDLAISVNNLLDRRYTDFTNLPMPGRWIIGEVKLNFNNF